MKLNLVLIFCGFYFIQACQVKPGGNGGDDLFSSHAPASNQFTLSTQLNRTYSTGETINFSLSFPKPVTFTGSPKLSLVIGSTSREALYVSGSGSASITFGYLVQASDSDTDGISVFPSLNLNSGSCVYDSSKSCGTTIMVPLLTSVKVNSSGVPTNNAPVAQNFTAPSFDEDTASLITLSYSDAENDKATACSVSSLVKVSITQACTCDAAGICKVGVMGLANLNGTASFNFQVIAGGQSSNSAKSTFTLTPVEDLPVAHDITPPAFDKNTSSLIVLSYSDADGDLATQCVISNPINITVSTPCSCTSGVCKLGVTGNLNYSGAASFQYQIRTNGILSNVALASLSISPTDQAPVTANINPAAFDEDVATYINIPYSDVDGDLATECAVASLNKVTVVEACACSAGLCKVRVQGLPDYNGAASFAFAVKAGGISSNVSTANLTISPVPDAPVASDINATSVEMNTEKVIQLVYSDAEGDLATICTTSSLSNLSVTTPCNCSSGICSVGVTGNLNYSGVANFNYTVTAGGLTSNVAAVDFTIQAAGSAVAANSTITGSSYVIANGTATSNITITLKDANNNPVSGVTPTFSATDSGTANTYGPCSSTNASGVSTCSLASTKAETKTLSIVSPVAKADGTVSFTPGPAVVVNSTLTGTTPVLADGIAASTISIVLKDAFQNPISGMTPDFSATDTGSKNTYGSCTATDTSGASTCSLKSLQPESKTLSLSSPINFTGGVVVFTAGSAVAANSTITGSSSVIANGTDTSTVTIILKDASNNAVTGVVPTFSATDTGTTNAYGICSATNTSGISTCSLTSTKAELKTLSLVTPLAKSDGTVSFIPGPVSTTQSTLTGTTPIVADGTDASTITVTLNDDYQNPIPGITPAFSATDTANKNIYGACSQTDATGVSNCTLSSLKPELKTLTLTSPVTFSGDDVNFIAGAVSVANSSISSSGPVVADGSSVATISIMMLDSNNHGVGGVFPAFTATDTDGSNVYGTCSQTNGSGSSTCTLSSTKAELKTLTIVHPITKTDGNVSFVSGPAVPANSTLTGTSPVVADGVAASIISIVLKDAFQNPISGTIPNFSATDTGNKNTYGACSTTDASGASTCSLKSLQPESKTLSLSSPISFTGGVVVFTAGSAVAANSTITGTGSVIANGTATSTVTITLKDVNNNGVVGVVPTFSATDTGTTNTYGNCSSTNASGVSTCTLASTKAELKTLSLVTPLAKSDGTVSFVPGAAVAVNSTLTGTSPVVADGVAASTISIVLKDAFQNPISGTTPNFSATDTGNKNTYGACSTTDASGASTCSLKSLQPESKTLSLSSPISFSGGVVVFTTGSAVAANSTITGTGPVVANGTSTSVVTITLKDSVNNPVTGTVPTFTATNTGTTNTNGTCSATNASGVSTCTLASLRAEIKTLSIATPVVKADGTVTFTAGAATAANSNITGSGPVVADGVATSTITVTLKDANNNPVSGSVPTFNGTNTGTTNVYGACSSSDVTGTSTCTLTSTRAQVKTLSLLTPVAKTGGTVTFIAGAAAASQSSITGTTPVSADGVSTSFVSVYIKDAFANAVTGVIPIFNATDTNSTNVYGACQASDATGLSMCTLASTRAEAKVLQLTSPVAKTGDIVTFSSSLPTSANSTITGTTPVVADGSSFSTVTITLKDSNNNPVAGINPGFDATNTGNGNTYGDCSLSDAGGVSSCTLSSTSAESKILRITSPLTKSGSTVVFTAGAASSANSTISGSGPVIADGVGISTITITLKDANNNFIAGSTPTFSATNTGSTNFYGACSATNASGVSTCTLKSTKAESKIPQILTPVSKSGAAISFVAGPANDVNSTITGTGPTNPDGVSTSVITITLKDAFSNTIASIVPTFSASGTNNTYGTCSSSNSSGVSTCTLASTTPEIKTLNLDTPVVKAGGTVTFASGSAVVANSSISATGPVMANGVATATVTITLKDAANAPVISVVPTFSATGSANSYSACSATNASGVSTCTMTSTKAESKTVSIDSPISKPGNAVSFTPGPVSAATTIIQASGPHLADGSDQSAVMVTIMDAFSNPISGVTPTISVSGSNNTLSACTMSAASGISTCQFKSTKAEEKSVNLLTPVSVIGNTVDFNPQGISLQVPIEMIDKGAPSATTIVTFARSRTSLDTNDYVSQSNTYLWEIIADNTSTSTDYTVYLVDSAGVQIDDSAITIPANTTTTKRFRGDFTPNDGADNYRIKIPATPTAAQVKIHTSRIIVEQFKAVATKIYIPLTASDALTDTSTDTGGQASSTTSASFLQPTVNNFYQYTRTDSNYDTYASGTPWMLETVSSTSNTLGTATVALFDKNTNLQIPDATTTVTGTTAITLRQVSFTSTATNFLNGSVLEARIRSSSTSYTTKVFKAGIWIKLKFLRKTEVPFRLVTRRSGSTTVTMGDGRFLWEPSAWSNPTAFFQVFGSVNTQTVQLLDSGTLEDGQSGTAISTITPATAYGSQTSSALSLTNGSRYIIKQNRSAGTVIIGGAFVLIRATE